MGKPASTNGTARETVVLTVAIFVAGLCSLVYELLISTVSSYFLGDSIRQFSITIGLYMAALGAGAYLSRRIEGNLFARFVALELLLGFLGGLAVPLLYAAYAYRPEAYGFVMVALILSIGLLIGFEIPFLTRLLESFYTLRLNISKVLAVDYVGALVATLLFPFILLPFVGVFRSSLLFGIANMSIAVLILWFFPNAMGDRLRRLYRQLTVAIFVLLVALLGASQFLINTWSQTLYDDTIVYSERTPYQQIVLTRSKEDIRLFLNGNLQFSSIDEYRYHEPLVHLALLNVRSPRTTLILGGGDGMTLREALKHPTLEQITLVDLDPAVVKLATTNPLLKKLNAGSFEDPRVIVHHTDAMRFLEQTEQTFDVIIADLPDPNSVSLARLYSREFYNLVYTHLSSHGVFVTQATSPFFARHAYWCIVETLESSFFANAHPFHANVPSFGEWGFAAARKDASQGFTLPASMQIATRHLDARLWAAMQLFPQDMSRLDPPLAPSTLDDPTVMRHYLNGWRYYR